MVDETGSNAARALYRVPGVYYEYRPIPDHAQRAFHTGVPAFVGFAQHRDAVHTGPATHHLVKQWEHFDRLFWNMPDGGYLSYAVRGYFENGGRQCIVVPIDSGQVGVAATAAALTAPFMPGGLMEDLDEIDLVCVPDVMMLARWEAPELIYEAQNAVLAHCHRMGNRFAILDAMRGEKNAPEPGVKDGDLCVERASRQWDSLAPGHGAIYFPWVMVRSWQSSDAGWSGNDVRGVVTAVGKIGATVIEDEILVPPCGHVAGIYARTDIRLGPHKAPANELIHDVLGVELSLNQRQLALLNEKGVNCLRSLPGRGIRIWGARTLSGESGWLYINVRRLFLTLVRWIEQNTNDLIFEPNNPLLWERFRQRLSRYCHDLFDQGALAGSSPDDAFYVKCDAETNPRLGIEVGTVIAEIGLAPVAPAEFVVVRITQSAGSMTIAVSPNSE
jgi:hypothetical protein